MSVRRVLRRPRPVAGYVSDYTLATGNPYTDQTLDECTVSKGRENEPAVAVDPRNTNVLLGSSNDYCGVYNRGAAAGAVGPIWLGYYRSEDRARAGRARSSRATRTTRRRTRRCRRLAPQSAGDPVIAWDNHGRAFFGSESSDDPAGSAKTFGDVWVARFENPAGPDAARHDQGRARVRGTTVVAKGSSAPNLLGKFNDKTAIEADRTGGACDGNVYFSWSRFTGNGGVRDLLLPLDRPRRDVLHPDEADAVDPRRPVPGHLGDRQRARVRDLPPVRRPARIRMRSMIVKSTDCGQTFSAPQLVTTFIANDAQDQRLPSRCRSAVAARRSGSARRREPLPVEHRTGLRRLRRPLHVRLHVLPPRHAGPLDCRPARPAARVGVHRLRRDQARHGSHRPGTTYRTRDRARAARPRCSSSATTARPARTRAGRDRQPGDRPPGVPGHLGGRRHPARDLVGQPERRVLQRPAADRELRRPHDGAVARRLRREVRRDRGSDLDRRQSRGSPT